MFLLEMNKITPELIAKALNEEGLEAVVDADKDILIKSDQLMIAKIYKEREIIKYFGSVPFEKENSTKEEKEKFIEKMNRSGHLLELSLFEKNDKASVFFELYIPLYGWVSSDFLSGIYWKSVDEVKNLQSYLPYISDLVKKG